MRLVRWTLASALLALMAGAAYANPAASIPVPSPLAISTLDFTPSVTTIVRRGEANDVQTDDRVFERDRSGDPYRSDAIRHRRYGYERSRRSSYLGSPVQLHLGFFDPDGGGANSFVAGLRGGPLADRHVQIGGALDWVHRSEDETVVAGDPFQQGNTIITPTRVLSRATSDLIPFQLFIQLNGDDNMSVIPYGGLAGGYQVLFLSADDFSTGESFDATFAGWGWQAWVGAALPLSGQSRFVGEFYLNQSEPEREVEDAASGVTFRERVNADGVGMRFGLQWGF